VGICPGNEADKRRLLIELKRLMVYPENVFQLKKNQNQRKSMYPNRGKKIKPKLLYSPTLMSLIPARTKAWWRLLISGMRRLMRFLSAVAMILLPTTI